MYDMIVMTSVLPLAPRAKRRMMRMDLADPLFVFW
jgi:hypothetical protein